MDDFKKYLDKITAEPELKEKSKTYVQAALASQSALKADANTKTTYVRGNWAMKKIITGVAALAACAVLAVGGYAYCSTPVNYVSFDINPSVELGINALNKVVSVEAYNEGGSALIEEIDVIGMPLGKAVNLLVKEAVDQGYMAEDGSTVISVTAESDSEEDAADLQEESEEGVDEALLTKNIQAIVYANCSNLELRTEAKELGISPGKYKLIAILCELDPSISPEDCRDMKITDIIVKANEIISENDSDLTEDDALQLIVDAAVKVMDAKNNGNKEEKINRGQNSNQNTDEDELNENEQESDDQELSEEQQQEREQEKLEQQQEREQKKLEQQQEHKQD